MELLVERRGRGSVAVMLEKEEELRTGALLPCCSVSLVAFSTKIVSFWWPFLSNERTCEDFVRFSRGADNR